MKQKLAVQILFLIAEFLADDDYLKKEIKALSTRYSVGM